MLNCEVFPPSVHHLLDSMVSDEESNIIHLIEDFLYIMSPFFVDSFKSLCLCLMTVFLWCAFEWIPLSLSYLEFIKLLGCLNSCFFIKFGNFLAISSLKILSALLSIPSLSVTPIICMLVCLKVPYRNRTGSVHFSPFFFPPLPLTV